MPTGWGNFCFSSKNHRYKISKWINKNKSFVFSPAFKVVCSSFILFGLGANPFLFLQLSLWPLGPTPIQLQALWCPESTPSDLLAYPISILAHPNLKTHSFGTFHTGQVGKTPLYIESIWEVGKSWEDDFLIKPWSSHKTSWIEPLGKKKICVANQN